MLLLIVVSASQVFGQNNSQFSIYEALITNYLQDKTSDFNFKDRDTERLVVTNAYYSENTDLTQVYVNQTYEGIKVFNAISSVAVKDGKVLYYANRFLNDISKKINATTPSFSPVAAIQKVATQLELGSLQNIQELERNENSYVFSRAGISTEDIPVELVYVKSKDFLVLAWNLIVYANDNAHWWSVRVNALTNEIIESNNLILTCRLESNHKHAEHTSQLDFNNLVTVPYSILVDGSSYNVFALPTESPSHGSREIVTAPASSEASPFGWHDVNGIAGAEYTITRGNNVWAREDTVGTNSPIGSSADGGSALNFDFPINFNLPPADYQEAAITNLFYQNNMMHDIWSHHGFDEGSGNFQRINYTDQGIGTDFVFADAQDGSGFDNANFGTPPDGFSPRMQMFLWTPPGGGDAINILNGSLEGEYKGVGASFGDALPLTEPLNGSLALAIDATDNIYDSCEALTNEAAINGNIAVIRRGGCQFGFKVLAAENAGAIAAIVVNNVPGSPISMGPGVDGDNVNIPSIMISQSLGESLISALENGEAITVDLLGPADLTDFVDSTFDNGIIAHEYGHGISNRLTGGPSTTNCLSNNEQMGEGWSDWFGLMVTMTDTDTPADARSIGTFSVSQPTTGGGIRPRPYSPDFAINELTYARTNDTNFLSQPHGIGSMWATVLWDLTWAYIDKYGFDSDLYNGDGGNNKIMKLVIDGLKLQPCSPGFVDGRDAILAADMLATDGANQCLIWEIFSARGLGFNASQGDSDSRIDQVEDFSMPATDDPSLANCSSLGVDEFSKDSLSIYPNPTQTELSISTAKNLGNVAITLIDINGRVVLELQQELFNTITINTSQLQTGLYILKIKGDSFNYNEKIIKN